MSINWYPGHMVKAQRQMSQQIKQVDAVIQLLDARAPWSCLNPNFDKIIGDKPRMFLMSKSDLADPKYNQQWLNHINKYKGPAVIVKTLKVLPWNKIVSAIKKITYKIKGLTPKVIVVGVPNAGKSTFINQCVGKKIANVADRPAVTRHLQWIKGEHLSLLDTPGVLWPKFTKETIGYNLALIGSIRQEVIPLHETTNLLVSYLKEKYPQALGYRFKIELKDDISEMILDIARKRQYILPGNEVDYDRTCQGILNEFRLGKIGRISLETPGDVLG